MWKFSHGLSTHLPWRNVKSCYRVRAPSSPLGLPHQRKFIEKLADTYKASPQVASLIDAYRNHGYKVANLDPLHLSTKSNKEDLLPELDPTSYSLNLHDAINPGSIFYGEVGDSDSITVSDFSSVLKKTYCGSIGIELNHVSSLEEREWLIEHFEKRHEFYPIDLKDQVRAACLMNRSLEFENFIAVKFPTVKRYSGEGCESMLVVVDEILAQASRSGLSSSVIGMPHRGRNSLLTCVLGHAIEPYLLKMRGQSEFPDGRPATGDTFSHFHLAADGQFGANGLPMHVSLLPNPSHLEAVAPVAVGKARAKMRTLGDGDYASSESAQNGDNVLCFLIHGDASMTGQGVISETALLAYIPHFSVGGSVHLVVNNQLGFTTEADYGRSFDHPTDLVSKGLSSPVLHVNGDDVEEVICAARLAMDYRQRFRRDVFLDLVCFRRWGHNELDDPSLTQPIMYSRIRAMPPLPESFTSSIADKEAKKNIEADSQQWTEQLQMALKSLKDYQPTNLTFGERWAGHGPAPGSHLVRVPTGLPTEQLRLIGEASVSLPGDFECHQTLLNHHIKRRKERLASGVELDWATAEALAIGSLLQEGHDCRISGQDVGRGTFSHRHLMFVDQRNDCTHIPFHTFLPMPPSEKSRPTGLLEVVNSPLSEEAVLSFEYGYSLEDPDRLVIWEAQFGDFFNSAQVPIDTYVASGETKWLFQSGMVMLLPHGYDGAGPEHSSCRLERFLQLCDSREEMMPPDGEDRNLNIVNPTTPAQYFHVLRRQMKRPWRKPLVVAGPKLLLRHPQATSGLEEMGPGTSFRHVLPDPDVTAGRMDPSKVDHVVFCTGKHFYALQSAREARKAWHIALVRIEQLCPFPIVEAATEARSFPAARHFVWAQEEPRNMGAWAFARARLEPVLGVPLRYAGRAELAAPAVGIGELHRAENVALLTSVFGKASA